jgi:fused signal recognition particle receptor
VSALVYVLIVLAIIVVAGGIALVSRRGGTTRTRPPGPASGRPGGGVETRPDGPVATQDVATQDVDSRDQAVDSPVTDDELPPLEAADGVTTLERPEPVAGRLQRLRARLAGSQSGWSRGLLALLSRDRLDEATWEEIEDTLLGADVGVAPAQELVTTLRTRLRVENASGAATKQMLREELIKLIDPSLDRKLRTAPKDGKPGVVMVVGVNGVGKTTTVGKLARVLVADDRSVLLGAADTFRAAAADQLQTWGERVGVDTVRGPEGSDPASVAYEAVREGIEREVDTVIVDTAGRLHTKTGLMDELGKVKRVIERQDAVDEVLLVLDATTGQNGLIQARIFREVVDVTGIVLTKLDGTAKGGIVIQVQRELGVPVKLVGLGEGVDDLAPFDATMFVDALIDG